MQPARRPGAAAQKSASQRTYACRAGHTTSRPFVAHRAEIHGRGQPARQDRPRQRHLGVDPLLLEHLRAGARHRRPRRPSPCRSAPASPWRPRCRRPCRPDAGSPWRAPGPGRRPRRRRRRRTWRWRSPTCRRTRRPHRVRRGRRRTGTGRGCRATRGCPPRRRRSCARRIDFAAGPAASVVPFPMATVSLHQRPWSVTRTLPPAHVAQWRAAERVVSAPARHAHLLHPRPRPRRVRGEPRRDGRGADPCRGRRREPGLALGARGGGRRRRSSWACSSSPSASRSSATCRSTPCGSWWAPCCSSSGWLAPQGDPALERPQGPARRGRDLRRDGGRARRGPGAGAGRTCARAATPSGSPSRSRGCSSRAPKSC